MDLVITIDLEHTGGSPLDASMTEIGASVITTDEFPHLTNTYSSIIKTS